MEEEGIFYFFTHGNNTHKLVLGDAPSAHQPLQPAGDVIYYRAVEAQERREAVMDFVAEHSVRSTKVSLRWRALCENASRTSPIACKTFLRYGYRTTVDYRFQV
jgi:hypothetical protein